MKLGRLTLLALALASAIGCGSSSGGTGVDASAAIAACNAYCDAYVAAACPSPVYTTAADCKATSGEKCSTWGTAKAGCQMPIKAYYDCLKAQANICDIGCDAEYNALNTCM